MEFDLVSLEKLDGETKRIGSCVSPEEPVCNNSTNIALEE